MRYCQAKRNCDKRIDIKSEKKGKRGIESICWRKKEERDWIVCTIMEKWGSFLTGSGQWPEPWTWRKKFDDAIIKDC